MSAPIGPGVWVECVKASVSVPDCLRFTEVARVYRVVRVDDTGRTCSLADCADTLGLNIEGDGRSAWASHCGCSFRPIYRSSSDLIDQLKQPAPAAVRELIAAET